MTETMRVRKDSEFFIAVAKNNGSPHSFVLLGVLEQEKPKLLARVGKWSALCLNYPETGLHFESIKLWGEVSYVAYAIDYSVYIEFIRLMRVARKKTSKTYDQASCYVPETELLEDDLGDDPYRDKYHEHSPSSKESKRHLVKVRLKKSVHTLFSDENRQEHALILKSQEYDTRNTCRHTALDLICYLRQEENLGDNVSSFFFKDLPIQTYFSRGCTQKPFYVLPFPPSAFPVAKNQKDILTTIYRRMEQLLEIKPDSLLTFDKFKALKALYNEQAAKMNCTPEQILSSIITWKQENPCIGKLRNIWFFDSWIKRTTATDEMVDTLVKDLQEFTVQR